MLENGFAFAFKESRWSLGYCVWVMYTTGMAKGGRGSPLCLKLFSKVLFTFSVEDFALFVLGKRTSVLSFYLVVLIRRYPRRSLWIGQGVGVGCSWVKTNKFEDDEYVSVDNTRSKASTACSHPRKLQVITLLHGVFACTTYGEWGVGENSIYYYTLGWRCWSSWH